MPDPRIRSARRLAGVRASLAAALALTVVACSLLVEKKKQQCSDDSECAGFSGATCDTNAGVCVTKTTSAATGSSTSTGMGGASASSSSMSSSSTGTGGGCDVMGGIKGGGCFNCTPTNDAELLNHCTDGCIPFDKKRVTKLLPDGKLPPLP